MLNLYFICCLTLNNLFFVKSCAYENEKFGNPFLKMTDNIKNIGNTFSILIQIQLLGKVL